MHKSPVDIFLDQLQQEATEQAKLSKSRILPAKLDWLTSFIGTYPWQTIVIASGLTALIIFLSKMV